jgi:hypothetical protein
MNKNARFIVVALLLVALGLAVLIEGKRGSQYRLGMTIAEVRSLTDARYPTQRFGLEYDRPPTPQQMNEDAVFYIYDEHAGVLLMFNHSEKLIQKKRTKWFGVNVIKYIDRVRTPK